MKEFIPIGVLGGTFDPIHHGHLRLAQEISQSLRLREVLFVPSGNPPHRDTPSASPDDRLQMVRLAISENSSFKIDGRELTPNLSGYTMDTLRSLAAEIGDHYSLCLLMGADAFLNLTTWSRWEQLFELAHIIIACRPGYDIEAQLPQPLKKHWQSRMQTTPDALESKSAGFILMQQITLLDISASKIRTLLKAKQSPRYLLPDTVLDYIYHHKLYL